MAYTAFVGDDLHGAIMFTRSLDCGVTWSTPVQIAASTSPTRERTLQSIPVLELLCGVAQVSERY